MAEVEEIKPSVMVLDDDEKAGLQDTMAPDSGTGSSVASSDTSASNEFLQGSTGSSSSTNPTRIIHLHHSFSHHHKILNSPTHSPPPPVQNFKRTSQVLDLDDLPPLPQPST